MGSEGVFPRWAPASKSVQKCPESVLGILLETADALEILVGHSHPHKKQYLRTILERIIFAKITNVMRNSLKTSSFLKAQNSLQIPRDNSQGTDFLSEVIRFQGAGGPQHSPQQFCGIGAGGGGP